MLRGLVACALAGTAVVGTAAVVERDEGGHRAASSGLRAASQETPPRVASPVHLDAAYVAPATSSGPTVGRLQLARLGIDAAVVSVGWDRDTMAVPNDPSTLGWFTPSARLDDLAGSSLVAGHVSDAAGRPGALEPLVKARVGDIIAWTSSDGRVRRFRVSTIKRIPRAAGLPASLFRVDGPHVLRLVTCTNRVSGPSGVHYTDNLVVSALAE